MYSYSSQMCTSVRRVNTDVRTVPAVVDLLCVPAPWSATFISSECEMAVPYFDRANKIGTPFEIAVTPNRDTHTSWQIQIFCCASSC